MRLNLFDTLVCIWHWMQSQNSCKWIFDLTKKDFSTLVASSMTSLEKKSWDPLRRATILSSWRKAKLDFGFDKADIEFYCSLVSKKSPRQASITVSNELGLR